MTARTRGDPATGPGSPPRLGLRLGLYAAGGSVAGIAGFGTLWRGVAGGRPGGILLGLALVTVGLLFAGVSLAAGMLASRQHRLRRDGSPSAQSGR